MGNEPRRGRPFLTARWADLFLATYAVPDEVLRPRLPPGLELDRRDGQAFVSLVAFDFRDTRVLGVSWPGYRNFPEINLRFYIRDGDERGVVFIRELVALRLVAWLANLLYNESYVVMPMASAVTETADSITVEHRLTGRDRVHTIRAVGSQPGHRPAADSVDYFFKEHQWGYGWTRRGRTLRYAVSHPEWEVYPVTDYHIDVDWASLYGPEWAFLEKAKPYSTVLAAGSAVEVYPHGKV